MYDDNPGRSETMRKKGLQLPKFGAFLKCSLVKLKHLFDYKINPSSDYKSPTLTQVTFLSLGARKVEN